MERPRVYRLAIGLMLCGLALLFLLSVASHTPHDPPGNDYPANARVENMIGIVGAYVSHGARGLMGTGCYFFGMVIGAVGVLLILDRPVEDRWLRGIGAAVILLSWCAGVALVLRQGPMPFGYGGLVGKFLGDFLHRALGGAGAFLLVLIGLIVGALLMADVMVLWIGRKGMELIAAPEDAAALPPAEEADAARETSSDPLAEQKERLRARLKEKEKETQAKAVPPPPPPEPPARREESPAPVSSTADAPTEIVRVPRKSSSARSRARKSEETESGYSLPGLDLLDPLDADKGHGDEHIEAKQEVLERTLEEFKIAAQVVEIDRGPVITQFELEIAPGVKITRIVSLADDLARALKAPSVRIVAPIPGKSTVGVEVPNTHREVVRFRELIESGVLTRKRMSIPLLLGKDASGEPLVADLTQMPHLLIAGATGSGKSVCINTIIMSFLMAQYPEDLKLILVDPKMVELSSFKEVPHLMTPVVTDMKKAAAVLEWACKKMDERYSTFANVGARNISAFNALGEDGIRKRLDVGPDEDLEGLPFHMPYIVIIIDELADLMMVAAKEVENTITRLAQKSRAVGMHLIVATQRPSVDVVTGLIKANLPSRIAFQMASKTDSRTVLDRNGAEALLGRGDMLFLPPASSKLIRSQGAYVSDEEIRRVTGYLSERARPKFEQELNRARDEDEAAPEEQDELFEEAVRVVLETQRGSVSLLQRKLGVGYSRAARLVDLMALAGIVGDYKGSQAREVMLTLEEWDARRGGPPSAEA